MASNMKNKQLQGRSSECKSKQWGTLINFQKTDEMTEHDSSLLASVGKGVFYHTADRMYMDADFIGKMH